MLTLLRKLFGHESARSLDTYLEYEDGNKVYPTVSDEWWAIKGEERIALLSDRITTDMSRYRFKLTAVTEDPAWLAKILDEDFWRDFTFKGGQFVHCATGRTARHAFVALTPFHEPGRLSVMYLHRDG